MRIVYFTHSLASCWNHGNAHFLRGVLRELIELGHEVDVYEPENGWSLANLLADHGEAGLAPYRAAYPQLSSRAFSPQFDLLEATDRADLVVVHEWNEPELIAAIGAQRGRGASFRLLFHDTHHRAISDPQAMRQLDLSGYDGVLAFGEALAEVYRGWGWGDRAFVWHEAADVSLFRPPDEEHQRAGLVWVGNWGDDERSSELEEFLLGPAWAAGLTLKIYGVRFPVEAKRRLLRYGAIYRGWLPNPRAPAAFARRLATVHVPRRFYVEALPGIPTIRVFEALACGIPLVSAPWSDCEGLFHEGRDYLVARNGAQMAVHLNALRRDRELRDSLVRSGLRAIRARHTCAHRAAELLAITQSLQVAGRQRIREDA